MGERQHRGEPDGERDVGDDERAEEKGGDTAPPEEVAKFQKEMTDGKVDWQMHIYGQTVVVNLQMAAAGLAETVTVTGEAPLINTTQSSLGSNIDPLQRTREICAASPAPAAQRRAAAILPWSWPSRHSCGSRARWTPPPSHGRASTR